MIPISKEFKQRVYQTIEIGNKNDLISRMFDIFLTVVIILNILVTFLQTFESLSAYKDLFNAVEEVTLMIFLIEYLLINCCNRYFLSITPSSISFSIMRSELRPSWNSTILL